MSVIAFNVQGLFLSSSTNQLLKEHFIYIKVL